MDCVADMQNQMCLQNSVIGAWLQQLLAHNTAATAVELGKHRKDSSNIKQPGRKTSSNHTVPAEGLDAC